MTDNNNDSLRGADWAAGGQHRSPATAPSGRASRRSSVLKRLTLFTAIGVCLLVSQAYFKHQSSREALQIGRAQLAAAEASWRARWGRDPSEEELAAILRTAADEEVLFRAAIKAGLHRTDPVVRRRLWQNMKFLEAGTTAESGQALLEKAYELNMHLSDIVVRRRLVQRYHGTLLEAARPPEPTQQALEAFIADHRELFETVPMISFTQIYLDGDVEGGDMSRPQALLDQLRSQGLQPAEAAALGDPLPVERQVVAMALVDVAKRFGEDFMQQVNAAPEDAWSGPFPSPYGWHVVWVEARQPAQVVLDEATLAKARQLFIEEQKETMVRNAIAALRSQYDIVVGDSQSDSAADERRG